MTTYVAGLAAVTGSPKSETSARTIPLTDFAAELCARMAPGCEDAYVLTGTREYMEPRALQYRMEKYTIFIEERNRNFKRG